MTDQAKEISQILSDSRTVAVIGMSDKTDRDSYVVGMYLHRHGYTVVPVNPTCQTIGGLQCYPSLKKIPDQIQVDIVDIFRRSDAVPPIVEEAIERNVPTIWMQIGANHEEAARRARAKGIQVISDTCIKKEHESRHIAS
ncbi:MAG TPA: CoA-binding protein [Thermoanaerobaculia bacterium]|mgnify:CR=1 FL=1|nr:CoA-binding protein [Thermoanaerobaculia bacterium]HUM29392.1 CoA-binding protein [Thermoanaerobaculia bacterium]HXK67638.1 CoA-binding protein [Thermoanaerobaculia bacterium]